MFKKKTDRQNKANKVKIIQTGRHCFMIEETPTTIKNILNTNSLWGKIHPEPAVPHTLQLYSILKIYSVIVKAMKKNIKKERKMEKGCIQNRCHNKHTNYSMIQATVLNFKRQHFETAFRRSESQGLRKLQQILIWPWVQQKYQKSIGNLKYNLETDEFSIPKVRKF